MKIRLKPRYWLDCSIDDFCTNMQELFKHRGSEILSDPVVVRLIEARASEICDWHRRKHEDE